MKPVEAKIIIVTCNETITIDKYLRSRLTFDFLTKVTHMRLPSIYLNMFFSVTTRPIELKIELKFEPVHEISNNVVYATSKASDQPAHTCSLIRAFASRLSIL